MTPHHEDTGTMSRNDILKWGTVRSGLALNFGGSLLIFLSIAIIALILILNNGQIRPGVPVLTVLTLVLSGYGMLGGTVLTILGGCMTSAAPRESNAKGWGIGAAVFSLLAMLVAMVWIIARLDSFQRQEFDPVDQFGQPVAVAPVLGTQFSPQELQLIGYTFQGTYLLAVCCFFLCQRSIAKQFGRDGLAVGICFYLLVYIAFFAAINVMGQSTAPRSVDDIKHLLAISGGGYLFVEVWGLILIAMSRGALTEGILRS